MKYYKIYNDSNNNDVDLSTIINFDTLSSNELPLNIFSLQLVKIKINSLSLSRCFMTSVKPNNYFWCHKCKLNFNFNFMYEVIRLCFAKSTDRPDSVKNEVYTHKIEWFYCYLVGKLIPEKIVSIEWKIVYCRIINVYYVSVVIELSIRNFFSPVFSLSAISYQSINNLPY